MFTLFLFFQVELAGALTDVGDIESLDLQPSKQRKLTDLNKCIICQMSTQEHLRKPKKSSTQTLVAVLKLGQDDEYERVKPELDSLPSVQWQSDC